MNTERWADDCSHVSSMMSDSTGCPLTDRPVSGGSLTIQEWNVIHVTRCSGTVRYTVCAKQEHIGSPIA